MRSYSPTGLLRGGSEEARRRLRMFWQAIGAMPGFGSMLYPLSGHQAAAIHLDLTPPGVLWDMVARNLSPYQLNPTGHNPLRKPLVELVDFARIRAQKDIEVMVCATNVRTANRRTFSNADISVDAVLASACLPDFFPAVEIDGEAYWDGGYTGNPALVPLLLRLPSCDFLIVRIRNVILAMWARLDGRRQFHAAVAHHSSGHDELPTLVNGAQRTRAY
jgi:NTE family protein